MQREEDTYLQGVQNDFKNRKSLKYGKRLSREGISSDAGTSTSKQPPETDIFFQKSKKNK